MSASRGGNFKKGIQDTGISSQIRKTLKSKGFTNIKHHWTDGYTKTYSQMSGIKNNKLYVIHAEDGKNGSKITSIKTPRQLRNKM